jgi:hypothetical protein
MITEHIIADHACWLLLQVLGSIMQVFLAEPLGEWQQERKALSQLASLADAAAAGAASSGSSAASGSAAAAAADQPGADVADLKVGCIPTEG